MMVELALHQSALVRLPNEAKTPKPKLRDIQWCHTCNFLDAHLCCAHCKLVTYCSVKCQREDWLAGHKTLCAKYMEFKVKSQLDEKQSCETCRQETSFVCPRCCLVSYCCLLCAQKAKKSHYKHCIPYEETNRHKTYRDSQVLLHQVMRKLSIPDVIIQMISAYHSDNDFTMREFVEPSLNEESVDPYSNPYFLVVEGISVHGENICFWRAEHIRLSRINIADYSHVKLVGERKDEKHHLWRHPTIYTGPYLTAVPSGEFTKYEAYFRNQDISSTMQAISYNGRTWTWFNTDSSTIVAYDFQTSTKILEKYIPNVDVKKVAAGHNYVLYSTKERRLYKIDIRGQSKGQCLHLWDLPQHAIIHSSSIFQMDELNQRLIINDNGQSAIGGPRQVYVIEGLDLNSKA